MKKTLNKTLFQFLLLLFFFSSNAYAQQVERVAVFEQWPGVSQLISYQDRIWFVNSEPFKDTNVADIYSYSIEQGSVQYERSLFSQDIGDPVIFNNLLHWPFEDPRRSAGTGEYAVTDGENWQWQIMQSGSVMHVHAMTVCGGDLVATTGSWTGQLHRLENSVSTDGESIANESRNSADGAGSDHAVPVDDRWQLQYDYPAENASFSRLVSVSEFNERCIVGASARGKDEAKLFSIQGDKRIAISDWPKSDRVDTLVQHQEHLFAFADIGAKRELLRYDGNRTYAMRLPSTHRPRALHSDGNDVWLVTHNRASNSKPGVLWKYNSAGVFDLVQEFNAVPISVGSHRGVVVIGVYAAAGGALWLYKPRQVETVVENEVFAQPRLDANIATQNDELTHTLYKELLELVADPQSTDNYARILRRKLGRHPRIKSPEFGAALTQLLSVPIEGAPITMFNGRTFERQELVRWYLLTTLAINGHGRINPSLINSHEPLNVSDSGKLFDSSIAAIMATGWLQQSDRDTLAALVNRLNNKSDPSWVKADVIGALTAITRQRHGYSIAAWNQWWNEQ